MINNILNPKKNDKIYYTGIVTTIKPLAVKLIASDSEIQVVHSGNLFGVTLGSKLILVKIGNELVAVGILGNPVIDCIELLKTTEQAITTTDTTKIAFDSVGEQSGSNFTFSGNGVKIGAGIKRVRVDCQCWPICYSTSAYSALYIYQNSTVKSYGIWPKRATATEYLTELWRTNFVTAFITVAENDYIYGYLKFSAANDNNKIDDYSHATKMIVQATEYDL